MAMSQNTVQTKEENHSRKRYWINTFYGEFDHGSGRTLATCLKHASRTRSSDLVANGVVIREQRASKPGIYRGNPGQYQMCQSVGIHRLVNGFSLRERFTAYQVVGEVTAHQADDG